MILKITACAAVGVVCAFICERIIYLLERKRNLKRKISIKEKWLLVIIMMLFGGAIGVFSKGIIHILYAFLLLCSCEIISVFDLHHRIIPNDAVTAIFIIKLLFGVPSLFGLQCFVQFRIVQSLLGLVVCFVVFCLPSFFGKNVGAGDVKLASALGFCLGLTNALFAVVIMGLVILTYGFVQRQMPVLSFFKNMIPMGPFIAFGMMVVLLLPVTYG